MNLQRHWLLLAILMAALTPTAGQQVTPTAGPANLDKQASIPDFSGIWRHGSLPWFIPGVRSRPGDQPLASGARWRERLQPAGRRLQESDPAAVGSGGRQEEGRFVIGRHHLSESGQHLLARTGAVPVQAYGHADAAAAGPGRNAVQRKS